MNKYYFKELKRVILSRIKIIRLGLNKKALQKEFDDLYNSVNYEDQTDELRAECRKIYNLLQLYRPFSLQHPYSEVLEAEKFLSKYMKKGKRNE